MKSLLKKLIPSFVMNAYVTYRRQAEDRKNAVRSNEEVFGEIYREKKWSDDKAAGEAFCSGTGSTTESIVEPYITAISKELRSFASPVRVVDLGCGDFRVGSRLVPLCGHYTAVDVVPDLIAHLKATYQQHNLEFLHLDITHAPLPDGDVCLVRQVFQHLSNSQIEAVLAKMTRLFTSYITEHHPENPASVVRISTKSTEVRFGSSRTQEYFSISRRSIATLRHAVRFSKFPAHRLIATPPPGLFELLKLRSHRNSLRHR